MTDIKLGPSPMPAPSMLRRLCRPGGLALQCRAGARPRRPLCSLSAPRLVRSAASKKGRCCSDADGRALSDVDWVSHDGRYRVQIDGEWVDVPDDAVITEPNRAGPTMVWPTWLDGHPQVRCFLPGSMGSPCAIRQARLRLFDRRLRADQFPAVRGRDRKLEAIAAAAGGNLVRKCGFRVAGRVPRCRRT